jgi:primase-polymerase (primpol)-like protein
MIDLNPLRAALAGPLAPLTQYKQFMLWRLEADPTNAGGKPRKIPYRVDGGKGSSTDPTSWTDATTALDAAQRSGMGVAFVLTDADPYVFVDIDGCVTGGQWDADFMETFQRFPGAAFETSVSHTGAHLFMRGNLPAGFTGRKRGKFECYRTGRYVALTGIGAQGSPDAVHDLNSFVGEKFPTTVADDKIGELKWHVGPIPEWNGPADDEELLKQFLSAPLKSSAASAFTHLAPGGVVDDRASNADLFNANVAVLANVYPSDKGDAFDKSSAAFALACRLAYWTGKDCPRIARLMDRAAFRRTRADLYHDNSVTYMQWDVMRACVMTTTVRFERNANALANAAVVADAAAAFDDYYSRIAGIADVFAMRALGSEIGADLRIDPTLRGVLAEHIKGTLGNAGIKLKIADAASMVAQRSAHPAPDRQAMQRQANISLNLPEETVLLAPVMTTREMLDEFVFVVDGSVVASLSDRNQVFTLSDHRNMMAASRVVIEGKTIVNSEEWLNHAARKMVFTRTFHAGAPIITRDPGGRSAVNNWRPIVRMPQTMDVGPFLEHVQYLFGNDAEQFLDWLAHIEQQPGVLPHHGWLHIADNFGTGRNWLESVICRLWRGYVAPSVDMDSLIGGGFNGSLAGRVIAVVDEIRAGAREDAYMMEGKIRNMLTEEVRYVKPKYGREYSEHNACRWLLFSNHKNAIPMDDNDRRWYVVHLSAAPRPDHVYAFLYGLLDNPAWIESVGAWLRARDISRFNPGARPPVTEAKRRAIEASKSDFQRMAALVAKHWPSDFIGHDELLSIMTEGEMIHGKRLTGAMKHALEDIGMERCDKQIYDATNNRYRVWFVRNADHWRTRTAIINVHPELMKMTAAAKGTGYQSLMALVQ